MDEDDTAPAAVSPRDLGVELVAIQAEGAEGRLSLHGQPKQPSGAVYASVFAAAAEFVALEAARRGSPNDRFSTREAEARVHEDSPPMSMTLFARLAHAGHSSQTWEVEFRAPEELVCARARLLLSVRKS